MRSARNVTINRNKNRIAHIVLPPTVLSSARTSYLFRKLELFPGSRHMSQFWPATSHAVQHQFAHVTTNSAKRTGALANLLNQSR
jgi:hypothetical protein